MRNKILIFLPACFVLLCAAVAPFSQTYKYTSEEGKMSITFPAPFESSASDPDEAKTVKITATVGLQTFFASYTLHDVAMNDREALAETSLNSFNETISGKITSKKSWKVKGEKGLIALIELEELAAQIQYQVVIIGNIQYQVVVVAPKDSWDQKNADRFFKTFKVRK